MKKFVTYIENKNYLLADIKKAGVPLDAFPKQSYYLMDSMIVFTCVGIFISRQINVIIFPKLYCIPAKNEQVLQQTAWLLKSIQKYNRKYNKEDFSYQFAIGVENDYDDYFHAMMHIIETYNDEGLLFEKCARHVLNGAHNINWNKTFKCSTPTFIDGNCYYLNTYSTVSKKSYNNMLTYLNMVALYESIDKIGFLYNISLDNNNEKQQILSDFYNNLKKYEYFLEQTIRSTFNDKRLELLNSIKNILFNYNSGNTNTSVIPMITFNFDLVWEDVIAECFGNQQAIISNDFSTLNITYNGTTEKRPQIPDTVYQNHKNDWVILDAKYYDIDTHRPGKGDYLKQYFYEFSFKYNQENITNALIFNYSGDELKYLGNAKVSDTTNPLLENKVIHMIGMDQSFAYKHYSQGTNISDHLRKMLYSILPE